MKYLKKKAFLLRNVINPFILLSLLLILLEAYKYEGFLQKKIYLPLTIILIIFLFISELTKYKSLYLNKIKEIKFITIISFILILFGFVGFLLDQIFYSGFFYTTLTHVNPIILIKYSAIFLFINLVKYFLLNFSFSNFLKFFFFFLACYIFITNWINFALSNFNINEFDGALRLIVHYYVNNNFIPYKDFGIVYPPGLIILGKFIGINNSFSRNLIFGSIFFLIIFILLLLVCFFLRIKKNQLIIFMSVFFIIFSSITGNIGGEPFSIPLTLINIFLSFLYLNKEKSNLGKENFLKVGIILTSFLIIFLRWEIAILLIFYNFIFLIVNKFLKKKKQFNKVKQLLIWNSIGVSIGLLCLLLYLNKLGSLKQGVDFIFIIPTLVILPYRKLPLPNYENIFDNNFLFYWLFFIFLLINIKLFKKKMNNDFFYISLSPIIFLPYALGRADFGHSKPFLILIMFNSLILYIFLKKYDFLVICLLSLIPIYNFLLPNKNLLPKEINFLSKDINNKLNDCKQIIKNKIYKSIFVGRKQYDVFITNSVLVYLIDPTKKPASSFISEEPGIQNSCKYGFLIYNELKKAKKPILVFLEEGNPLPEPNKTQEMKSCGKIELFINNSPYQDIGRCNVNNRFFEVRLYN